MFRLTLGPTAVHGATVCPCVCKRRGWGAHLGSTPATGAWRRAAASPGAAPAAPAHSAARAAAGGPASNQQSGAFTGTAGHMHKLAPPCGRPGPRTLAASAASAVHCGAVVGCAGSACQLASAACSSAPCGVARGSRTAGGAAACSNRHGESAGKGAATAPRYSLPRCVPAVRAACHGSGAARSAQGVRWDGRVSGERARQQEAQSQQTKRTAQLCCPLDAGRPEGSPAFAGAEQAQLTVCASCGSTAASAVVGSPLSCSSVCSWS